MSLKKFYKQKFISLFFSLVFILVFPINCNPEDKNLEEAYLDEKAGNHTQAMYRYDISLRENPNNKIALKRLGLILTKNPESWGVGIMHLEKALELDPLDEEIRKELFFLYLATENYDYSEKMLIYWKAQDNPDTYKDWEGIYQCIAQGSGKSSVRKIVDESPLIPETWKKRCLEKASKK